MDYSKCRIDPVSDKKSHIWKQDRILKKMVPPEYADGWDWDKLIRYAIASADRDSPIFDIRDLDERHEILIKEFNIKEGSQTMSWIKNCTIEYRMVLMDYFIICNDQDYHSWISKKMFLATMRAFMMTPIWEVSDQEKNMRVRNAIQKEEPTYLREIKELEATIFKDEHLMRIISEEAAKDNIGGYAERFARMPEYMAEAV